MFLISLVVKSFLEMCVSLCGRCNQHDDSLAEDGGLLGVRALGRNCRVTWGNHSTSLLYSRSAGVFHVPVFKTGPVGTWQMNGEGQDLQRFQQKHTRGPLLWRGAEPTEETDFESKSVEPPGAGLSLGGAGCSRSAQERDSLLWETAGTFDKAS